MEFTKEQKEIIKEMYNLQLSGSVFGARIKKAFPEVLKPKRKKIVVEIEWNDEDEYNKIGIDHITRCINDDKYHIANCINPKVTELPEVFTREDVHKMFDSKFSNNDYVDSFIDKFLSERNKI